MYCTNPTFSVPHNYCIFSQVRPRADAHQVKLVAQATVLLRKERGQDKSFSGASYEKCSDYSVVL